MEELGKEYYIGFVDASNARPGHPIGWDIIRWFQDSPIVHCFMVYKIDGVHQCYQTTETKFDVESLVSRLSGTTCHIYPCRGDAKAAYEASRGLLSKPYDYPGIIGLGAMLIGERVLNWIFWPVNWLLAKLNKSQIVKLRLAIVGNPAHLKQAYFCSESCILALQAAGVWLPSWWQGNNVTPRQLHEFVVQHDELFGEEVQL